MDADGLNMVNNRIGQVAQETLLYACSPNQAVVNEALSFNAALLGQVDNQTLSKFTIVLSQYSVFMQVKYNTSYVRYVNAKKRYDFEVRKVIIDNEIKGKSGVEKEAKALYDVPELSKLKGEVDMAEAERGLLQDIDKALKLLIEAYKKEMGRRHDERGYSRGGSSI